jgi:serine/threonine protein kinase
VVKIEREFECLQTIARSELASSIRVPKLAGLVEIAETRKLVGILEAYIPHHPENPSILQDLEISTTSELRRKKWTAQIRETVDQLHGIGVVWGGGKPHNVLINSDTDDAWLIDFGRGSTDDWVDEEIMETKKSDEQAVEKIFRFLEI